MNKFIKKILVFSCFLLGIQFSLQGQEQTIIPKWSMNVKLNYSIPQEKQSLDFFPFFPQQTGILPSIFEVRSQASFKAKMGFSMGSTFNFKIKNKLYLTIEPEIQLTRFNQNSKFDYSGGVIIFTSDFDSLGNFITKETIVYERPEANNKVTLAYLSSAASLKYLFLKNKLSVQLGFFVSARIYSRIENIDYFFSPPRTTNGINTPSSWVLFPSINTSRREFNAYFIGLKSGLNYHLNSNTSIQARYSYGLSMLNEQNFNNFFNRLPHIRLSHLELGWSIKM